jgi:outer membrane protein
MSRRAGSWRRAESGVAIVAFVLSATAAISVSTFAAELVGESRVIAGPGIGVGADTLEGALVLAYQVNPQLNSQRAATRAVDENVGTALSGYRPKVSGTASLTEQYLDVVTKAPTATGTPLYLQSKGAVAQPLFGLTATETLYNGLQTGNRTRQAEGQVFSAREALRFTEQTVLLSAATAYMNLLRDAAVLELQRSNVNVLEVTLRQTRDRFTAGEVTRTDVAQAESSLAAGRAQLAVAESNYVTSRANFRQVIGVEPPARLAAAMPVDRFFPRTMEAAVTRGRDWARHHALTSSA